MMQNAPAHTVLNIITDFLATNPTPEEIINYTLPDDLQSYAHELLDRNGEGELTLEEQQDMFEFMYVDEMMGLLKAKTLLKLRKSSE